MQGNELNYDEVNQNLTKDQHEQIYGKPERIIEFMDYMDGGPPDNSCYIPNLVPSMLQPLEDISDGESDFLSTIDIEAIIKEV